jgi:hypothetical protein
VLSDIVNAGWTIGFEQNRENLADKIGISSAFPYIATAFCTGAEPLVNAASAYFAPFRLFVFNAARAFPRQEFAAGSAIETARCYVFFVSFHIRFYLPCKDRIFPVFFVLDVHFLPITAISVAALKKSSRLFT